MTRFAGSAGDTLAILGASGHGKVVAEAALAAGWARVQFYDRAWPNKRQVGRWSIVGDDAVLSSMLDQVDGVVVAIGDNQVRLGLLKQLQQAGAKLVSIEHPMACISGSASLGLGTVALAGAIVNADATVGMGAILNTGCSVDHDCVLADGIHVSPGARLAGNVQVGEASWVGIGAVVRQGIHIGARVVVGAAAAVVRDVSDDTTVVGVPARPLSRAGR